MLQVTFSVSQAQRLCYFFFPSFYFQSTASTTVYYADVDNAGNNGPAVVHGCQMGTMSAAVPNDIEGRPAATAGAILDATVPSAFGAVVHFLGHHRTSRGRASAR